MKKIISIILILAMVFSLTACGSTTETVYTLDKEQLENDLFSLSLPSGYAAYNNTYIVTDELFSDASGEYYFVGSDVFGNTDAGDYIMLLPISQWTNQILIAVPESNTDAIEKAEAFMQSYIEEKWLDSSSVETFTENGYSVWSVSSETARAQEVFKNGTSSLDIAEKLTDLEEYANIFANNMVGTLDTDYYVFEGVIEKENLEDMFVLASTMIGVHPVIVLKPTAGMEDEVKANMQAWIDQQYVTFESYMAYNIPLLDGRIEETQNGYLIYVISSYNDPAYDAIMGSFVEVE